MSAEASLAQANAQLRQAQVNLKRTRIVAPVDGYVTNLLVQLGDYLNVGANALSTRIPFGSTPISRKRTLLLFASEIRLKSS